MKELSNIEPDKLKVTDERPVKKESRFLGSMRSYNGHKIWQLELATTAITEVEFDSINYKLKGGTQKNIITKKGFLYCSALNIENAEKKFKKMITKMILP